MMPKILLVDDEPKVTDALTKTLRNDEYEILSAHSAEEALQVLAREPIDVVVTDEQMPGMSGSELLARVCREYPDTVRIILTGHGSLEAAVRAINEGEIYRFLEKPCDAEQVDRVIRQALQQRRGRSGDMEMDMVRADITGDSTGESPMSTRQTDVEAKPQRIFLDWTVPDNIEAGPGNET